MRICHVVGDSAFGGGSMVILALMKTVRDSGYDVSVIATDPKFCRHAQELGVNVVELECIWRDIRPHRDLVGLLRLKRHFDSEHYDIVHTHTSKAGFVGRIAAYLAGVRAVIHTAHGFSFHEGTRGLALLFQVFLERIAGVCCHRIATVSEFHRDWARRLKFARVDKIVSVPNGVPDPGLPSAMPRSSVRIELGLDTGDVLVLSASRLAAGKGLEHLVESAALLVEQGRRNVLFAVAGSGPFEGTLRSLVEERGLEATVRILGFRSDISDLLAAADIVVLPSEREGLSIALLEGLAAGKAMVLSSIGSNLEAASGVAEFASYGDVTGLAERIERLASDGDRRRELGERARQRYKDRYTEERMVRSYLSLYADMV